VTLCADRKRDAAGRTGLISAPKRVKYGQKEQLAERIGISRNHLAAIEAPNVFRGISVDAIFSIAKVLEIDVCLLFQFSKLRPVQA
jgi:transcriptional regulator with XRE-family HTH domain